MDGSMSMVDKICLAHFIVYIIIKAMVILSQNGINKRIFFLVTFLIILYRIPEVDTFHCHQVTVTVTFSIKKIFNQVTTVSLFPDSEPPNPFRSAFIEVLKFLTCLKKTNFVQCP